MIKQDDIGGHSLDFDTKYSIDDGYSSLVITTSGARYLLNAIYDANDDIFERHGRA
jgi:hypothetical protein